MDLPTNHHNPISVMCELKSADSSPQVPDHSQLLFKCLLLQNTHYRDGILSAGAPKPSYLPKRATLISKFSRGKLHGLHVHVVIMSQMLCLNIQSVSGLECPVGSKRIELFPGKA